MRELTFHSMYGIQLQTFSLTLFSQKFCESNGFTKEITKWLTKFFFSEREFLDFPQYTVVCTVWKLREISLTHQFFRETVFQEKTKNSL